MLRRLTFAFFAFCLSLVSAQAWFHHGAPTINTSCLFNGFLSKDGCTGAPSFVNSTINFQDASLLTAGTSHAFQVGQSITANLHSGGSPLMNWNVAGQDFPVGIALTGTHTVTVNAKTVTTAFCNDTSGNPALIPCSTTPGAEGLIDAIQYFTYITTNNDAAGTGCKPSGSNYNVTFSGSIVCTINSSNMNFNGFDFTPLVTATPTCAPLYVKQSGTGITSGSFSFTNNRLVATNTAACLSGAAGTSGWEIQVPFTTTSAQSWNCTVNNNYIDLQSYQSFMAGIGTGVFNLQCGVGNTTVQYNYFGNVNGKGVATYNCGNLNQSYNVIHNVGWDFGNAGKNTNQTTLHTEWEINFGISSANGCAAEGTYTVLNNTAWQDASLLGPPAAFIFDIYWSNAASVGAGDFELNTTIPNYLTGAGTQSWTLNYNVNFVPGTGSESNTSGGSGYAQWDIVAANATYGGSTPCETLPKFLVMTVDGSGKITKAQEWSGGRCNSGASSPGSEGAVSSTAVTGVGTGATFDLGTYANSAWQTSTASAGMGFQSQTYSSYTVANNFIDKTGLISSANAITATTICTTGAFSFTGNTFTSDGSTISFGGTHTGPSC